MKIRVRVSDIVEHPYYIGLNNKPLRGKVVEVPEKGEEHPYWLILWRGDKKPTIEERDGFIKRVRKSS